MSYQDGISAINLVAPPRIPRTEYSADMHWELVNKVTGIPVTHLSSAQERRDASRAFRIAWNFDFVWNICIANRELGKYYTDMGHGQYNDGGGDIRKAGTSMFKDEQDVLRFDPMESLVKKSHSEMVEFFNNNYRERCADDPNLVNMTGIYITCMSGLIDLFGWDLLLTAAGIDPDGFGETANRYAKWIMRYFEALAACEAPVVMVHDDIVWTSGPFITPEWYRRYVFPNYQKFFKPLRDAGKKILYTSDGDYTAFVDDIASSGVHGFVMEPLTDMAYIAQKYGKTHVIAGNADTRILLRGSKEDIYREVKRCMDIGKNCPGFFMAVGNHIPANTPVENALYYNECYEKMSRR